ncbi:putative leucine-rich repeat domain, L domain-containing protein [Medicago truncatula]|uniref:Putative leucine-rich repeat domain, L domain-containing protein n=1 Tax=Medicago truncatula TaxID=3880 RepID=A0A396GWV3_MEDTR|nr:putative leucine-rich repeat domain, L domain-containing protein [Medicago truncatula]
MKRKRSSSTKSSQQAVSSDLPNECWELIFRFILKDENNLDYYSLYILNSLSLVSKQFLSITNTLRLSLSVPFSRGMIPIFKRFTDITSLKFDPFLYPDLDKILCKVSRFPLKKLTSLDISYQCTIPANGLRVFSQNIRTLTSLTCSDIDDFNTTDLFLIAECFPLLEELNLIFPSDWKSIYKNYNNYCDGIEALSLALVKLRKVKLCRFPMSDKSLFYLFNSCKLLEDVTLFECDQITIAGIASAIRERPTLKSLSFCNRTYSENSISNDDISHFKVTSDFIDSLVYL